MQVITGKTKFCAQKPMAADLPKSCTKHPYSNTHGWTVATTLLYLPGQLTQGNWHMAGIQL
jgi:hypothetical protein